MVSKRISVTAATRLPKERTGMTNAERQRAYRERKKALEAAQEAAARGDIDAVTEAREDGVAIYLQSEMDAVREREYNRGHTRGMRDGFAGGRLLEQLLNMFLDGTELYDVDAMRKTIRGSPLTEATIRAELVAAGVPRDEWLIWLGGA